MCKYEITSTAYEQKKPKINKKTKNNKKKKSKQ